jgi:hypothetical protein
LDNLYCARAICPAALAYCSSRLEPPSFGRLPQSTGRTRPPFGERTGRNYCIATLSKIPTRFIVQLSTDKTINRFRNRKPGIVQLPFRNSLYKCNNRSNIGRPSHCINSGFHSFPGLGFASENLDCYSRSPGVVYSLFYVGRTIACSGNTHCAFDCNRYICVFSLRPANGGSVNVFCACVGAYADHGSAVSLLF